MKQMILSTENIKVSINSITDNFRFVQKKGFVKKHSILIISNNTESDIIVSYEKSDFVFKIKSGDMFFTDLNSGGPIRLWDKGVRLKIKKINDVGNSHDKESFVEINALGNKLYQ